MVEGLGLRVENSVLRLHLRIRSGIEQTNEPDK